MKNHLPGFVPINFKQSGKVLLIISLICLIAKLVTYLTNQSLSDYIFYIGIGIFLISLYLIFIVPEEK